MPSGTVINKKMLKYSHPGEKGRSLIERLEIQMDKRRKKIEQLRIKYGNKTPGLEKEVGRYEGIAASIAIMRSSSMPIEISRSNERLGIEE